MYPQSMFWAKIRKTSHFFICKIIFFTAMKNCSILHGDVFVMTSSNLQESLLTAHTLSVCNLLNFVEIVAYFYIQGICTSWFIRLFMNSCILSSSAVPLFLNNSRKIGNISGDDSSVLFFNGPGNSRL